MKLLSLFLMLIVFLPFSSASIEIVSELENEYNLGDDIEFSVKIIPGVNADALVKLTLKCTNREVPYYVAPVELEEGEEINIDAPSIKAFSEGLCDIRVNVESLEGEDLEGISSEEFTISDRLELSFTLDKTDVFPGDKIRVEGMATKKGGAIEEGSVIVELDNKRAQIELDGKEFSYELELDEDIRSGGHTIIVEVNDSHGNYGEEDISIDVRAIPTELMFNLNNEEFKPFEELELTVLLLDQAGDDMDGDVDVKLFREKLGDDIVIFDTLIEANEGFSFTFNYSTLPYDYVLEGSFGELSGEEIITILPYPKIEMNLEGYTIFIKNVGNVRYNNETTILVEREGRTYFINKRIKLDVGEETTIDLSKEVSSGNYTVILPSETVSEEKIVEKTVEKIVEKEVPTYVEKEKDEVKEEAVNVIRNVEIEDNRPIYKKGMDAITGGFIAGAGVLLARPRAASFVMIFSIAAILYYFNRKKIKKVIEWIRERREERY